MVHWWIDWSILWEIVGVLLYLSAMPNHYLKQCYICKHTLEQHTRIISEANYMIWSRKYIEFPNLPFVKWRPLYLDLNVLIETYKSKLYRPIICLQGSVMPVMTRNEYNFRSMSPRGLIHRFDIRSDDWCVLQFISAYELYSGIGFGQILPTLTIHYNNHYDIIYWFVSFLIYE